MPKEVLMKLFKWDKVKRREKVLSGFEERVIRQEENVLAMKIYICDGGFSLEKFVVQ